MELERVGGISVSDFLFQVGWQVDNVNSAEGTLLWANTTTNAQILRDESDLGGSVDLNTQFS